MYGEKPPKSGALDIGSCGFVGSGAGGGGSSQRGQAKVRESGFRGGAGLGLPAPSVMAGAGRVTWRGACVAHGVRRPTAVATPPPRSLASPCFGFAPACLSLDS